MGRDRRCHIGSGVLCIFQWMSATKVAFVNYQIITLGEIHKANDNSFIKIATVDTEELDKLKGYDMVFINAMGLRITEEQRAQIQKAADEGLPVLSTAVTNPANKIISIDSLQADTLKQYLSNGGRHNYRSMLNYVRKYIDGKKFSLHEPEAVVERANDMLYHAVPGKPDEEELGFNSIAEYHAFLRKHGLLKEGAPRIIITGPMGQPADLIRRLEETGNVVYPVRNMKTLSATITSTRYNLRPSSIWRTDGWATISSTIWHNRTFRCLLRSMPTGSWKNGRTTKWA